MVIEPNIKDFENLINLIPIVTKNKKNCGDQDVIIEYFIDDWRKTKELHLDDKFNMIFPYIDYYINSFKYTLQKQNSNNNIKIIHFIGVQKPWMTNTGFFHYLKLLTQILKSKLLKSDESSKYYRKALLIYKMYLLQV